MNVGIRCGSLGDQDCDVYAEEKNRSFGMLKGFSLDLLIDPHDESKVFISVPPKMPGMTCQTDVKAYEFLEGAYEAVIMDTYQRGLNSVCFSDLGCRWQKWGSIQSAHAARKVIEKLSWLPDDFTILFVVPAKEVEVWDSVMDFDVSITPATRAGACG